MNISNHVLGVLASALGSPARRRLTISLLGTVAIALLPAAPAAAPAHLVTTPAAGTGWLDRLNSWRTSTGVPTVTENPTWSQGDAAHALYMVKNDLVTHYETPGVPYYTAAGDAAAKNSNIYVSSSTATTDEQAIDWWMQAPFHSMGLMDPRLTQSGFGSYREVKSGWQLGAAVDVLHGLSASGHYPVYFPGSGGSEPLTTYGGGEFPDPLQGCSGYSAPTGLPVYIEVGPNVSTTAGAIHSFTGNGVALEHCVIDSSNPAVGSSLVGRGGVIVIPRQPLQSGVTYTVVLTVNGTPYTWSFKVGPLSGCAAAGIAATPSAPQLPGTTITVTGSATCSGTPTYRFWVGQAGVWSIAQDYSTATTFSWNTAGKPMGTYGLEVDVRSQGDTAPYETVANLTYLLGATGSGPCNVPTLNAASPSVATGGTAVFTASTSGCPAPNYRFWVGQGGMWKILQDYGSASTFNWSGTGVAGTYGIEVDVRDAGALNVYDHVAAITYSVVGCGGAHLITDKSSPQVVGPTVTLTGSASCAGTPEYRFWIGKNGAWTIVQDYGASSTYSWNTTGLAPGTYGLEVDVRNHGGTATYETAINISFVLFLAPCTSAHLATDKTSPQAPGSTVVLTAGASCPGAPEYRFWVGQGGAWTIVQDYGPSATLSWNTTGMVQGTYGLEVDVRNHGVSVSYETVANLSFVLSMTPCTAAHLSTDKASPQVHGTTILLTGSATCAGTAEYRFWVRDTSGRWTIVQDYSPSTTFSWNTTGLAPGTYGLEVDVRNQSSPASYETVANLTFQVN